jgi:transposase
MDIRSIPGGPARGSHHPSPWRDLPERYGPYTTCDNRFVRWRRASVWDRLFEAVADLEQADLKMIDSTVVRVHQQGASVRREPTTAPDVPAAV